MRAQYTAQYNLAIQRELTNDMKLQVGYVGSQGHRLLATHDINFGNPQTCLDIEHHPKGDRVTCGQFSAEDQFSHQLNDIPTGSICTCRTVRKPPSPARPTRDSHNLVGLRPYSSPNCDPLTGTGCPPNGVPVFTSIFAQDTIANSAYNSLQARSRSAFPMDCSSRRPTPTASRSTRLPASKES